MRLFRHENKQPLHFSGVAAPETIVLFAVIACMLGIGMVGFYAFGMHGSLPFPQDGANYVLGRDFLNTWFFGKAAYLAHPGRFYDHDLYMQWISEIVPQDIYNHLWSYPPSFFFLAAPFGALPYPLAFAAWTVAGLMALYAVVRNRAKGHNDFGPNASKIIEKPGSTFSHTTLVIVAILCSPAALFCLIGGQISLFMAAIMLAALGLIDRRPILSGLLIALCTIKPQMGFLIPVLLIASRRWLVLAVATLGTLFLVFASSAIWGFGIWSDYVQLGLPAQIADTNDTYTVLAPWSPTITTAMIMAGLKPESAMLVQLAFTALAAALVGIGCAQNSVLKRPMDDRRIAFFLACSIVASPYLLAHDLVAMTAAAVMLAASEPLDRWGTLAVKAVFLLPMLQFTAALAHIPGVAFVPIGFALWAFRRGEVASTAAAQMPAIAALP
jgi:hypothetical protein